MGSIDSTIFFALISDGLICSFSPLFFQEDLLNEISAEMKALRAVVLAQSQRIEVLEKQLANIVSEQDEDE